LTLTEALLRCHLTTSPEVAAVELSQFLARSVPAYQAFLRERTPDVNDVRFITVTQTP
jgi:hypothetical protein